MDLGGAILAHQRAKNRVTTVAIDRMTFIKPVYVGDLVCCFAKVVKTGRSSIVIQMQVWTIRMRIHERVLVAEGTLLMLPLMKKVNRKPLIGLSK